MGEYFEPVTKPARAGADRLWTRTATVWTFWQRQAEHERQEKNRAEWRHDKSRCCAEAERLRSALSDIADVSRDDGLSQMVLDMRNIAARALLETERLDR
jgi:hypothetical protein